MIDLRYGFRHVYARAVLRGVAATANWPSRALKATPQLSRAEDTRDSLSFSRFTAMPDVTQILSQIESGDRAAAEELLPLVYDELRRLATAKLAREKPGQTLQATALVHEAYLRLVGAREEGPSWDNRGHFFAAAAEAMRRILVENARRKKALRHGGGLHREPVELVAALPDNSQGNLLALEEALQRLEQVDKSKADLVKLRYFAGLTIPQAAEAMHISLTTANRYWAYARAWLHEALSNLESAEGH